MLPGHKKVLEIGCAGNPMGIGSWHPDMLEHWYEPGYRTTQKNLELFCGSLPSGIDYFGVDSPQRDLARAASWVAGYNEGFRRIGELNRDQATPNITFEEMDATELSYDDESFEEVHMHFVLDDPTVPTQSGIAMIREATRVVKPGRPIILTGNVNRYDGPTNRVECVENKVRAMVLNTGFDWPEKKDHAEELEDAYLADMARSYFKRQWPAMGRWDTYDISAFLVALRK